jgi:hypothetical protein
VLAGSDSLSLELEYSFPAALPDSSVLILSRGSRWYPLIADQVAPLTLTCEVPKGFTALSAGNLVGVREGSERTTFVWRSGLPVFKVPLAVFRTKRYPGVIAPAADQDLCVYRAAGDTVGTGAVVAGASQALAYYSELLGAYPLQRLTLLAVPDFPGIDVASGLLLVGTAFLDELRRGRFDSLDLTIAQQWFGAGVFGRYGQPGFWLLTLSLPHYLRWMYLEATQGDSALAAQVADARQHYLPVAGTGADLPLLAVDGPTSREKGLVLYAKGPLVLDRVRRAMGDARWTACLRAVYSEQRGRPLGFAGFRDYVGKFDERGGAAALLDSLARTPGMPGE